MLPNISLNGSQVSTTGTYWLSAVKMTKSYHTKKLLYLYGQDCKFLGKGNVWKENSPVILQLILFSSNTYSNNWQGVCVSALQALPSFCLYQKADIHNVKNSQAM